MDAKFLYVMGATGAKTTGGDLLTLKCSKTGSIIWAKSFFSLYQEKSDISDYPTSVAVDKTGNVYVVGTSFAPSWKLFFLKYSSEGDRLWLRTTEDHEQNDYPKLGTDRLGNVYIVQGRADKVSDNYTVPKTLMKKYSSSGDLLWQKLSESPEASAHFASIVDSSGNIYFTGFYNDSKRDVGDALFLMRYSTEGKKQWTRLYRGSKEARGFALVRDSLGNLYVAGTANRDYITLKYPR